LLSAITQFQGFNDVAFNPMLVFGMSQTNNLAEREVGNFPLTFD